MTALESSLEAVGVEGDGDSVEEESGARSVGGDEVDGMVLEQVAAVSFGARLGETEAAGKFCQGFGSLDMRETIGIFERGIESWTAGQGAAVVDR
jgi:hypothetical protein